ncbi:histidine phosphatase family protein [Dictyobacter arantiisoli]|uniref:histidine phosphatase family protein n=1 Tax=Dictyobacter arantiisoli TaxID=2014874 RepID=UPI001C0E91C8
MEIIGLPWPILKATNSASSNPAISNTKKGWEARYFPFSDLQRATTTTRIAFAEYNLPMRVDARLCECDYGDLTQYPFTQIETERKQRITKPFPTRE